MPQGCRRPCAPGPSLLVPSTMQMFTEPEHVRALPSWSLRSLPIGGRTGVRGAGVTQRRFPSGMAWRLVGCLE